MKNTPKKGEVRVIVFKDNDDGFWYAVALEFNIVVSANSQTDAIIELNDAIEGYLEVAQEIRGTKNYSYLNQNPIAEYEDLWNRLQKKQSIPSPYQVAFHGLQNIHA